MRKAGNINVTHPSSLTLRGGENNLSIEPRTQHSGQVPYKETEKRRQDMVLLI
jgi:hypothetical protein